ncbi:branched-chain amino acid ABC transporter permease [Orrella sp. NBD-18]|uniref:Branched-chain amino acid ABC transporter permease n=1 Tax=Sheuella amnicola TaxID=2707330 RepID=A0A6B2QZ97_9BURK|nr:branched-chain amino acid ABC transporter permease [Sheuella amnicola]NDY82087.1 branched-chain amino acid ABC transporter permease [Sheuella amnicola]
MSTIFATGLIGMTLGGQYALLAMGFTLIFGIIGVMNFAHGAFFVLGGYVAFACVQFLQFPYPVAVIAAGVVTAALGYLYERYVIERTIDDGLSTLMLTLGLAMVMITSIVVVFGVEAPRFEFPITDVLFYEGLFLPVANLILVLCCGIIILGVYYLLYRTSFGRSLRAISCDREIASTLGLRANLLFPLAFALATALAGVTGALVTPILALHPHVGDHVLAMSFIVVILGGLGSLWGAVAAAFIVGLIEAYSSVYLGGTKGALALFVLVMIMLIVKPSGLFGREARGA